jgi:Na+-transporting NADH:ubiquinone oxidoreductase subunit A
MSEEGIPRLKIIEFDGPHPAGLVGTHIHFLDPVDHKKTVWHLNYQDVIAIGRLFRTGRLSVERVIALGGPCVKRPRLLRTRLGANTEDLVAEELVKGPKRIISGSVLSGRTAAGPESYLGRYHLQLSVIAEASGQKSKSPFPFQPGGFSVYGPNFSGRFMKREHGMTTALSGRPTVMVPMDSFERVVPLDILPTPLLRALTVGDLEQAEALGCLELNEEDLALCTFVCPSKLDYGALLRSVLDRIEKEGRS